MSKKLLLLCSVATFIFAASKAQKITISLPDESNKKYVFILNKGVNRDTIQQGQLSTTGMVTIRMPQKDNGYVGIGSLQIDGSSPFNMIINKEDFDVEKREGGKYKFSNSKENDYLYSIIQDGIIPDSDTTLYAYHFTGLIRYRQQLNKAIQGYNLMEKAQARTYALERLNMEKLYTSGLWPHIIDGLLHLNSDQSVLGEDMVCILKRIISDEVFEHLVSNLITITEQYGWGDAFDIIIPYAEKSGRIKYPQEKIFTAFSLVKVRKGMPAPPIDGLTPSLVESQATKTLLLFYAPDCDNCHKQLEELIKFYPKLNHLGIRVVSISSDHQKESFEKDKARFPWPDSDKLCDLNGFAGKNYLNYGIMATPTFFLIDNKGKIIKRYALIADIEFDTDLEN